MGSSVYTPCHLRPQLKSLVLCEEEFPALTRRPARSLYVLRVLLSYKFITCSILAVVYTKGKNQADRDQYVDSG